MYYAFLHIIPIFAIKSLCFKMSLSDFVVREMLEMEVA